MQMILISLFAVMLTGCPGIAGAPKYPATEWEHGYKTDVVIATRYRNPVMGYNIGFKFPKDPNNADRAELSEFMKEYDGWIYQGGGYPGAEMFVIFKAVKNKEDANPFLLKILPELSELIDSL